MSLAVNTNTPAYRMGGMDFESIDFTSYYDAGESVETEVVNSGKEPNNTGVWVFVGMLIVLGYLSR